MNIQRLTSVNDVVRNWTFLASGLAAVGHHLKYKLSLDSYRKVLFRLVKSPTTAWFGICHVDDLPVAFLVAHESTPFAATEREFDASIYYHLAGHSRAIAELQHEFELFCKLNDIRRFYVTTRRHSGRPIPLFSVGWTGLKRAYLIYQKEVT